MGSSLGRNTESSVGIVYQKLGIFRRTHKSLSVKGFNICKRGKIQFQGIILGGQGLIEILQSYLLLPSQRHDQFCPELGRINGGGRKIGVIKCRYSHSSPQPHIVNDPGIAGYQKKNKILSDKEKLIVAYHEVGHALVAALQTMGVILALGLFLLPAITAILWCERLPMILLLSVVLAVFGSTGGILLSYHLGIASGPSIVLTLGSLFLLSTFISNKNGLLPQLIGKFRQGKILHRTND